MNLETLEDDKDIKLMTKEEIIKLISETTCKRHFLEKIGKSICRRNYLIIEDYFNKNNIDFNKLKLKTKKSDPKRRTTKIELSSYLKNEIIAVPSTIKNLIIKNNLLPYKCSECGVEDKYNNKPIKLHMDHIDGNNQNNNLTNLRFLCPNCHSQTETYCRIKNIKYDKNRKCSCGNKIFHTAKNCKSCYKELSKDNIESRKVIWPTEADLKKLVWEKPRTIIAKEFGVSDKAVSKWCKKYNIDQPPRGYWAKKAAGKI